MAPNTDYLGWIGHTVIDESGSKIGKVEQIYLDDQSGQPEWLTVKTGMFGGAASFVPLSGANARGDDLMVPYGKDMVKDAPRVEEDADGHLQPEEEAELYRYYGRQYGGETQHEDTASGQTGDKTMTRSEEELRVGKTQQEVGRARLRKYVVTEQVQTTVPVTREEVRVEREPITDANRDHATSGQDISEAEHEVVLHEEQPVVDKQVVPKERVRLAKDQVTDEKEISEDVRKERIETEGDVPKR